MANVSLKEQLQAVASQLTENLPKAHPLKRKNHAATIASAKPRPQWLDYVQYGVELLKVYFPASFKSANQVIPLKKGIKQDLVKKLSEINTITTDDKACMVKSLSYYVNTLSYHKRVLEGMTRVDLEGNAAGTVTAEEAAYSLERQLAKIQAKQQLAKKEKSTS